VKTKHTTKKQQTTTRTRYMTVVHVVNKLTKERKQSTD